MIEERQRFLLRQNWDRKGTRVRYDSNKLVEDDKGDKIVHGFYTGGYMEKKCFTSIWIPIKMSFQFYLDKPFAFHQFNLIEIRFIFFGITTFAGIPETVG